MDCKDSQIESLYESVMLLDHDAMDYEKVNYFAFGSKFDNFWYKW